MILNACLLALCTIAGADEGRPAEDPGRTGFAPFFALSLTPDGVRQEGK